MVAYHGNNGDPEKAVIEGVNKHGTLRKLTVGELFSIYEQKKQSDFTDPEDPRLSYVFDLFYDVKTESDLRRHIKERGIDFRLQELMDENKILL